MDEIDMKTTPTGDGADAGETSDPIEPGLPPQGNASLLDEPGASETQLVCLPDSLDQNPAAVYLGTLGPSSRPTMRQSLDVIAQVLSSGRADAFTMMWPSVAYQHTALVRQYLAEHYRPATANKMLCALRGVLKQCWQLGLVTAEAHQRAAAVQGIRAEVLPAGRALSAGEIRALFAACAACRHPTTGARDAALIALLFGAGLRRSEAVKLLLTDYAPGGMITVRRGKGRKDRICHAAAGGDEAICAWLALRGDVPGPLLCPVNKSGRVVIRQLTPPAARSALLRVAAAAGVAGFSPHDLRRTFISDLLDAGADIASVQKLAGHAQVTTTTRYDRRGEEAKKRAVSLIHVPFVPRAPTASFSEKPPPEDPESL